MMSVIAADLDRQALILLCAPTSIGGGSAPSFGPAAWHDFQQVIVQRRLSPGQLLGMSETALKADLDLTADQAQRVTRLLARGGPVAIEIERLASRGIWISVVGDETYPPRLAATLGGLAPPLLFGVGRASIAAQDGLAIVGSRDADEEAIEYTESAAALAVKGGLTIVSGAARGVDAAAMTSALEHGGSVVGVVADGLEKRIREPQIRTWLADERLCLITPYGSNTGFSVGAAMGRNKLTYGLSAFALVVAVTAGKGGTWAGATEALKNRWSTVFVRPGWTDGSAGDQLVELGALAFPDGSRDDFSAAGLENWIAQLGSASAESPPMTADGMPVQATMFGEPEALVASRGGTKARSRKSAKTRT